MSQTQIDEAAERVKFEADYIVRSGLRMEDHDLNFEPEANRYYDDYEQSAWEGWLAAKRAVLSEAKPVEVTTQMASLVNLIEEYGVLRYREACTGMVSAVKLQEETRWKMAAILQAIDNLVTPPAAEAKDSELIELHQRLASEALRADQGWARYESANKRSNEAEKIIAAKEIL